MDPTELRFPPHPSRKGWRSSSSLTDGAEMSAKFRYFQAIHTAIFRWRRKPRDAMAAKERGGDGDGDRGGNPPMLGCNPTSKPNREPWAPMESRRGGGKREPGNAAQTSAPSPPFPKSSPPPPPPPPPPHLLLFHASMNNFPPFLHNPPEQQQRK